MSTRGLSSTNEAPAATDRPVSLEYFTSNSEVDTRSATELHLVSRFFWGRTHDGGEEAQDTVVDKTKTNIMCLDMVGQRDILPLIIAFPELKER
jgi:hypothetical protein